MTLATLGLLLAAPADALQLKMRFDGKPQPREASKPITLELAVLDDEGAPASVLLPHHEKTMHLVAVPEDLSELVHVHPHDRGEGRFSLRLRDRKGPRDLDNDQAVHGFAKPGTWWVFAEVSDFPGQTVVLQDRVRVPGKVAARALPSPMKWAGDAATASIDVDSATMAIWTRSRRSDGTLILTCKLVNPRGEQILGFRPWLGMSAHGVLLGKNSDGPIFRHLHPEGAHAGHGRVHHPAPPSAEANPHGHHGAHHETHDPGAPGDWTFILGPDEAVPSGTYRFWLQARRDTGLVTLPFTLSL
ncbi:MAG: hypothetical protein VKO21_00925 [Candidatus Sericytochromatia bacterium]|nr:hypothetical protein [Candidatus Sericytochromatia bacterium]